MNKEQILRKAQSKKTNTLDEMQLQVVQKGSGIAVFSILVFCLILMTVKIIAKQPWYDAYSICLVSMGTQHFYKGIKLHQKHEIIFGIVFSVLATIIMVGYICEVLG
ncbi:DUF6442 family protein [Clostridium hydrogenum]|uniref:DUF6442 family protein n=1 Tax=Clostridium hydrogenum TaxID=2855764 RepID=UPI001F20E9C0|nr:DUF6442 family protein [Clostridium hydrogenum]